eukprot:TRINITY_DN5537_c1_g3_i1.p1 TRINITY_DN5537_c1_g3~~TRINITY_DN5537_c1_g3_i1.p1  ORF type:complete len:686 (+),score=53.60 TRINITY_DN5537_c1_g3_i1:148-2205(+)
MTKGKPPRLVFFLFLYFIRSIAAVDFLFNGFDASNLTLYGNATVEAGFLTLTKETHFSIGRAFYTSKIRTKSPNHPYSPLPFSTSFIFSITPSATSLSGHGFTFLLTPSPSTNGTSTAQNLGLFNVTNNGSPNNHVFAVEFDVFQNPEFLDIDSNHIGVNINSLTSTFSHTAGFWPQYATDSDDSDSFVELNLNGGANYHAWIDFSGSHINVSMAQAGFNRPKRPLISAPINLSGVLLDEMYVGFTASTGLLAETHRILSWSFSNSNFSAYKGLINYNLPCFMRTKKSIFILKVSFFAVIAFVILIILIFLIVLATRRNKTRSNTRDEEKVDPNPMEDWELEYWPHRIRYQEISAATNCFSKENLIGIGGTGKVYKGVLGHGSIEIAVKCIPQESKHGLQEFIAEVSTLGRLKHRNLVGLIGWCKPKKGCLMLVYEYMENGSLDKRVFFDCEPERMLGWVDRLRVLNDVAAGVLYLHEGWEMRVLHRDIKASNVMIDKSINGRLGDFGLARMHPHGQHLGATRVVGTVGYMAPELVRHGRASAKTDVFGLGVLVLEVVCGRRPVEEGSPPLIEWVWGLMEKGKLVMALDQRLRLKGGPQDEEVERVLHLGLACVRPDPSVRPSIRQVVKVLEGVREIDQESEGEGMDTYLLQKADSAKHPTFEDVKQLLWSSMSLSRSDIIREGR